MYGFKMLNYYFHNLNETFCNIYCVGSTSEGDGVMEVTPSDEAALPVASAAPTLATA